jgi:hypothetical protein
MGKMDDHGDDEVCSLQSLVFGVGIETETLVVMKRQMVFYILILLGEVLIHARELVIRYGRGYQQITPSILPRCLGKIVEKFHAFDVVL